MITQGLVIDEPWIFKILAAEKTWEMRSRATRKSGPIALIRKGSGLIVGSAEINCREDKLTLENWEEHFSKHRIPIEMAKQPDFKWFVPWKLSSVTRFETPVPYAHPSGAVTWVNLSETEISRIASASRKADADDIVAQNRLEKRIGFPRQVKLRQFKK